MIFILTATFLWAGCSKEDKAAPAPRRGGLKFPVEVTVVASRSGNFVVHAVGSVEAFETVQVTARVAGAVQKVRFKEGDRVQAGDTLAEIQPERYELAARGAAAALEKAIASLHETQAGLGRRLDIESKNPGFVSPEDLQDWQTRALSAEADSVQAAANLELARLNQRDSYVPAPVAGIIQSRNLQTGQYLQAGTLIATLLRRDPLLLRFTVSDQDAQRLRNGLEVSFNIRDDSTEHRARITAVAESADPSTRLVNVTAEVIDTNHQSLRPGAFAQVTAMLGESENTPAIPQTCIRPSERGFLAFVVQDSIAHERVLTLGLQSPDGYVEVRDGLQTGETIVVRGAEALSDGATVRIASPGKADSTLAKPKPEKIG
jgi:multidrug efflux system membrane fusion protein